MPRMFLVYARSVTNSSVPAVHDAPHDTPLGRVPLELALHNPALQEVLNDASRAERNLTINSIDAARPLILAGLATTTPLPVSYTHLTLPTKA